MYLPLFILTAVAALLIAGAVQVLVEDWKRWRR